MPADLQRAQHLMDLRREREAETVLRSYLAGEPESARALRMLVEAIIDQDRGAEALEVAQRAAAADPESEHGHRLLAIALKENKRHAEAVTAAREAVRLAPYMWQTHYVLGATLRSGRRPRSREALACANQAVRLAPHEPDPHNLAGLCLTDLGLTIEAATAYGEVLRLDPTHALAMNNLAALRFEEGSLASASAMLTSGLSMAPQETVLHQNYDAILLRLIRRLSFALVGLGIALAVLAGSHAPYLARVGAVVLLLGTYATATWQVTRHLPRGSHLWARGLFKRSDSTQRILVAAFVLLSAGVVVMGLAPRGIALGTGVTVLTVLRIVGFGMIVFWLLRASFSLFRRDPD